MGPRAIRGFVAVLGLSLCATAALVGLRPAVGSILTEDQNADGRPDVWRYYDARGELTRVDTDTNFDGRSDRQEYYDGGALVRRESDRNFDDRIDLVEEFDPKSHEQIRSVVDVDFDGAADLLTLFQDGRPVFSKTAPAGVTARAWPAGRRAGDDLDGLVDPFRGDRTLRSAAEAAGSRSWCLLASAGGLPVDRASPAGTVQVDRPRLAAPLDRPQSSSPSPRLTRGPPFAFFL